MADLASLGFEISSTPLKQASSELGNLTTAADKAGTAADDLAVSTNKATAQTENLGTTSRKTTTATDQLGVSLEKVSAQASKIDSANTSIIAGMSRYGRQALATQQQNEKIAAGFANLQKSAYIATPAVADVATGMSSFGRSALETSQQNERLIKGMSQTSAVASEVEGAVRLSGNQIAELGHIARSTFGVLSVGGSVFQALGYEANRIVSVLTIGPNGVGGTLRAIGGLLSGIFTPARLATAAFAALALTATGLGISFANAQSRISLSLTGIGQASGVTVDDINKIATAVSSSGRISESSAEDIATAIASTGKVSADTTQKVTALTKAYSLVFGKELIESAGDLANALADPTKGVDDLNKRLAVFSDAEAQAVKHLDQAGNRSAAQKIIVDGLQKSIGDAEDKTTGWARAWDKVSKAASDAATEVGKAVDKANGGGSLQDQLAFVQSQLQYSKQSRQQLVTGLQYTNPEDVSVPGLSDLTQLEDREKQLKQAIAKDTQDAINAAQIEESGIFGNLIRQADPTLSRLQEIDAAIKRIQADQQNWGITGNVDPATLAASDNALKNYKSERDFLKSNIALAKQRFDVESAQLGLDARSSDIELASIAARTPAQKAEIEYRRTLLQYGNSADAQAEAELARTKSLAQSQHDLNEAMRDRLYSSQQAVEQGNVENATIGRSVEASTRLTQQFQLLAAAKQEAFKNGTTVSLQEQLDAIVKADQLARQAAQGARDRASSDLAFGNAQLGRSDIDQQVYAQLQSAGLLDKGQITDAQTQALAGQIRLNQELQRSIDIEKGFASDFLHDMLQGKSATEALGNALDNLASKILDNSLNTLFSGLTAAGGVPSKGLFGGNILPGILHEGGVAGSGSYPKRSVSASLFAGAPRYHSGGIAGLKPDEVPAILQKGEVVLPRGASGGSGGGVSISVPVSISADGADASQLKQLTAAVVSLQQTLPKTIITTVQNAKSRNLV